MLKFKQIMASDVCVRRHAVSQLLSELKKILDTISCYTVMHNFIICNQSWHNTSCLVLLWPCDNFSHAQGMEMLACLWFLFVTLPLWSRLKYLNNYRILDRLNLRDFGDPLTFWPLAAPGLISAKLMAFPSASCSVSHVAADSVLLKL